jgi:hypothetical protein
VSSEDRGLGLGAELNDGGQGTTAARPEQEAAAPCKASEGRIALMVRECCEVWARAALECVRWDLGRRA